MHDDKAFSDLKHITWKVIAACKNVMRDLPTEARERLLAEVTAAEELLGKISTGGGKDNGKRKPAGAYRER